jgi:hypothetical protein
MVFSPAQENNMSPANQLSNAINAFKQWRATRKKTTHKTPEALQQQVVELLSHYSRGTISNALGLSGSQVKRWQVGADDAPAFVELPVLEYTPGSLQVELRLPNGAELSLSGSLSPSMMGEVIRAAST